MKIVILHFLLLGHFMLVGDRAFAVDIISNIKSLNPIVCRITPTGIKEYALAVTLQQEGILPSAIETQKIIPVVKELQAASAIVNSRLEICTDENGALVIRRWVHKPHQLSAFLVYTSENSDFLESGLLSALATQDYSKLRLIARSKSENKGAWIQGISDPAGPYAAAMPVRFQGTSPEPTSLFATVGKFQMSDAFGGNPCEDGNPAGAIFQLGTAKFEAEICTFLGGGMTTGYTVRSLAVTDSAPQLPAEFQNKQILFSDAGLKESFRYFWLHHNWCDSFLLKVPQTGASYSALAEPVPGCQAADPELKSQSGDPAGRAIFRIQYPESEAVRGVATFSHYFF